MAVYFLYAKKAKRIKIGYSSNPKSRISSIQTASPEILIQLAILKGEKELEQGIHSLFHHLRENGEWFRAEKELFEWIYEVRQKKYIPFVKLLINDQELRKKEERYRKQGYIVVYDYGKEDKNGQTNVGIQA